MFRIFILSVLVCGLAWGGPKTFFKGDGIVPPKKTSAQRDALTGNVSGQILYNTDTLKLNQYNGTSWVDVGSGEGGINYVSPNHDAEGGTSGWATYADAAAATPADGTGGSANVTWTQSSSTPLRGSYSFRLTKDAANRQGQGVSYAFTIAEADKAKPLNVSFEYRVSAAAVAGSDSATGDVNVYVYDVTNSTLIQPTPFKLPGGTGNTWKYSGQFQASSSSTSYRLIFHVAGTNASAATYDFDSVVVGPQLQLQGAPVTDWVSYTPTGNWVSNTTFSGFWRRVGESMHVRGRAVLTGAPTSAVFSYSIPSGYTINDSVMPGGSTSTNPIGIAMAYDDSGGSGYSRIEGIVVRNSSTSVTVAMLAGGTDEYTTQVDQANPFTFASGDVVAVEFSVPITGWGSNVVMSQDADTRVVVARAVGQPSSTTSGNVIIYGTESFDTHGAYDNTTGRFTAPLSGFYEVSHQANSTNTYVTSVYKNAASDVLLGVVFSGVGGGSVVVQANAGDILDIRPSATTGTFSSSGGFVQFKRLSGAPVVAASEKIFALAYGDAASASDGNPIIWPTVSVSTHGAYNVSTGRFTAPSPGLYRVQAAVVSSDAARQLYVNVDAVDTRLLGTTDSNGEGTFTSTVNVLAGQVIDVRPDGGSFDVGSAVSWVSFEKL